MPSPPSSSSWLPQPRAYRVSYRLKLAQLHLGQVAGTYFAYCTRRFGTNELNVVLADIYAEVGPAADLVGIEILTICQVGGAR